MLRYFHMIVDFGSRRGLNWWRFMESPEKHQLNLAKEIINHNGNQ